jgi:DNA-binding response OmpR family regulator
VTVPTDLRKGPDRRKYARGGRRPTDKTGFAPLVLVADEDAESGAMSEVILAKLRFAVARVDSVDKAVTVLGTLRPDVIVARAKDLAPLQRAAWPSGVPFVAVTDENREPEELVDAIRRAIRDERQHAGRSF